MSEIPEMPVLFAPKKNARLDNVIEMLKDHIGLSKNSDKDKKLLKNLKTSKTEKTNNSSIIPSEDSSLTNSYLMWQNSANVCWLDSSMALLVHNRTLIESINESSMAQISKIVYHYYKAVSMLNDCSDSTDISERVIDAKDMLKTVQESALRYLQPILKYKEGEPDSAFCSLFNLISEDKAVKELFDLEYTWVQVCQECNTHRAKTHRKPIITLPRVEGFQPSSPISLYQCLACKAPDQRMTLNFKTLPQCLLFHFESGAGKGELQCTNFKVDERIYQLTGVMTHEKGKESNANHFVTFIRDSRADMWMECNDLCDDIMCFSVAPPSISLQDVYILMFEAMDGNGTVPNLSLDSETFGEESAKECIDIPLIDLEDEAEEDKAETCRKVASEYAESKNILGNVDLPGKDWEEGSNKDMMENSCLNGNDPCDVSCENANLQRKDSVNVSSDDNSKEVDLFGTAGLFAKFHLAAKDKSSQNFSKVYQGGSKDNTVHDITMSACDNTTLSECNETLPDVITSTDAVENNPTTDAQSQLNINNIENNSLQSESIKISSAYVSLDKDILSLKINNVKSLCEVTHFPKDMQPDAHIVDGRAAIGSDRSKSSKGAKKKLLEKDKLVSHHHAALLGPEKATNKTSANFLVPEPLQTESIEISTADGALDKDILSLQISDVKSLGEVTHFPKDMEPDAHIVDGPAAIGSGRSKSSKGAKKKLLEKDKLVSHHQKTLLGPEKSTHFLVPKPLQNKSKKMSSAYVSLDEDILSLKNIVQSLDEVTHFPKDIQPDVHIINARAACSSGKSNRSKGVKKKLIEKDILVPHHQKTLLSPEKSTNETLANILVPEKSETRTSDVQPGKIDSTSLEAAYRNASYTSTESKTEVSVSSQNKTKSHTKNRKRKLGSSFKVEHPDTEIDNKLQAHDIKTCIAPETTSKVQVIKKHKIEKVNKDFKNSSKQSNKQLIAKQRKAQTVLKSRKQKSVDGSTLEDNSTRTDDDLQRKAIIIANVEKVIETVSKLGNFDVIEEQLKIQPDLSSNLSNKLPNISSIAKQRKDKSFSKNEKRKFMDSLQSEVTTKMEDVSSNTHTDKSFSDVPPKRTYTRRNLKPAVEQQNETILETAKNKRSDDNDQNDKYPSSDGANSKVNALLPSNHDGKIASLHGPGCLCDGMKMAEDLVDMVVGNVLKNMFNFLGIKEKK